MGELKREQAIEIIQRIHKRFGEDGADPVHKVDTDRKKHYFMETEVNPPVLKGWDGHARQWTGLRDTNTKLVARLTSNPILPDVSAPRPSSNLEKQASDNQLALTTMLDDWTEEDGVSPQTLVAFGIGTMSAVGLHWYLNDAVYDGLEDLDYEEVDELPEDEDGDDADTKRKKAADRKRYVEDDYAEVSKRKKKKTYRETDDSLLSRRSEQRAMAGSPWCIEVLEPTEFGYMENPKELRRKNGQYKYLLKFRAIDLLDWQEGMKQRKDGVALPLDVQPGGVTTGWTPTANQTGRQLVLYQLWSADYIYEYVEGAQEDDFRCIPNRQKRVPLALCAANINLSKDHVHRYEPALASLFRKKPEYDRYISNRGILAETGAIARYILQPLDSALPPLTDEEGHIRILTEHSLDTFKVPEGYKLERIGGDGAGADYVRYGEELRLEMSEAMPGTGHAEIESSTKPWTGRMMLTEANIFPAMCLDHMTAAYRTMFKNMAEVNGSDEGPGDICFYPKKEGKKGDEVIVIKPEQWKGLRYDAIVNKTSAVEQVTKQEHMREMLNDPLVMLPLVTYIEEGEGRPNPEDEVAKRRAIKYVEPVIENAFKALVAEWAGAKFLMTPDLRIADMTGRQVTPGETLTSIGQQPTPPPQGIPPGGGAGVANPQVRMPSMAAQPGQNGMAPAPGLLG
jgi:hypothetical protein